MSRDNFSATIESLNRRLEDLQKRIRRVQSRSALAETAAQLRTAAGELNTLHKQISNENVKLAASRQRTEDEKVRYQNLFHLAPDGYLVTDRPTRIYEANYAAGTLLAVPSASFLIGKPLAFFVVKENRKTFLSEAVEAIHGGQSHQFESRLRTHDKRVVDVLITVGAAENGASLRWSIRDITARKQTENKMRGQERLATMGSTALLLAREISNPLNSMFTAVQRLQRDPDAKARVHESVQDLISQTARMRGLLEKFLSFARPISIHRSRNDLTSLVKEIVGPLTQLYSQRGIKVSSTLPPTAYVEFDYERLKEAILNVCINAVEAMPQGGELDVYVHNSSHAAVVEITDTGQGVPDNIDVFDLFTTTKFQGMGMGLPIARQIILDHGGKISYVSRRGNTEFLIDLPAALP